MTTTNVDVAGNQNQVVTVGHDLVIAPTRIQQKSEFYEPKLDQFKPPQFVSPKITPALADVARSQRLLVLGGDPEVDKAALARHITWYLDEQIAGADSGQRLPILEWDINSGQQSLIVGLQKAEAPTLFILPQVLPPQVGYDLLRLQQVALAGKHYIIAGTDTPFATWKFADDRMAALFWREPKPEELYAPADLGNILIQALTEAQPTLPEGLRSQVFEPDRPLIGGLGVQAAAGQLRTPSNIAVFVQLLCAEKRPLKEARAYELLELARDQRRILGQWFKTVLTPREQLMALGLAMFDGLFDDQAFGALDCLMRDAWRPRDPFLVYPDYQDLDDLSQFFSCLETSTQGFKLESRLPDQRTQLLGFAWNSDRRKILAALPTLVRLVKDSVVGRSHDPELYGSVARRESLRQTVGETLSDIGQRSVSAVEDALLQLAVDEEGDVQAVAANALARWRLYGKDEALFGLLARWQREARFVDLVNSILKGRDEKKSASPEAYLRSTVVLAVSFAAQYDPPNQLSDKIVELMKAFADDQNELVRDRFRGYTLPLVVPQHVVQLRDVLHDMVRYVDLISAVGTGLARAYELYPRAAMDTLDAWYAECEASRPPKVNQKVITHRDALLATVALTYGHIQYGEPGGLLTADDAFHRLQLILEKEKHAFIRTAVVIAITLQAHSHFDKVEPQLRRLVAEVTPGEREEIVKILAQVYLEQREQQSGGQEVLELKDRRYAVWKALPDRPLTAVETAMLAWIKDRDNPVAQQIATQVSVEFAKALDQEEERFLKRQEEAERRRAEAEKAAASARDLPLAKALRQSGLTAQVAAWLVTLGASQYRETIQSLLPEAVTQRRAFRDAMNFVLSKWQRAADAQVQDIAKYLKRGLPLVEHAGAILLVIVMAVLSTLCMCSCLLMNLLNSRQY